MTNKFDRDGFQDEVINVINKYSENGNEFANAEIVAGLTSIFISVVKQAITDKKAGKYLMESIIEDAFK